MRAIEEKPWPGLDWALAPEGFNWAAQDADGRWYWYSQLPQPGIGGGVWRANSRHQQYAGTAAPNPDGWLHSLQQRGA